jgi:hypothetical protein
VTGYRAGGPPGKRSGPEPNPVPVHSTDLADHLTKGLDVGMLPPGTVSETVYVVHVCCGALGWRRLYLTADSALTYADRMGRRGHQAEVSTAILVGGAW